MLNSSKYHIKYSLGNNGNNFIYMLKYSMARYNLAAYQKKINKNSCINILSLCFFHNFINTCLRCCIYGTRVRVHNVNSLTNNHQYGWSKKKIKWFFSSFLKIWPILYFSSCTTATQHINFWCTLIGKCEPVNGACGYCVNSADD